MIQGYCSFFFSIRIETKVLPTDIRHAPLVYGSDKHPWILHTIYVLVQLAVCCHV